MVQTLRRTETSRSHANDENVNVAKDPMSAPELVVAAAASENAAVVIVVVVVAVNSHVVTHDGGETFSCKRDCGGGWVRRSNRNNVLVQMPRRANGAGRCQGKAEGWEEPEIARRGEAEEIICFGEKGDEDLAATVASEEGWMGWRG